MILKLCKKKLLRGVAICDKINTMDYLATDETGRAREMIIVKPIREREATKDNMNGKMPRHSAVPREQRGDGTNEQRARRDRELLIMMTVALSLLIVVMAFFLPVAWRRAQADAARDALLPPTDPPAIGQNASGDSHHSETTKDVSVDVGPQIENYMALTTEDTVTIDASVMDATHAILVDLTEGVAVAERMADERIYPASMTKVMTVLVAAEALTAAELETLVTVSPETVDAAIREGASRAGFEAGERVKLIDLLYGAALPSGADATATLAQYIAGSEEKYVELMNQKAQKLGMTQTNFVNASGLHDDAHYSTVREIAALMAYAMDNDLCRQLLSATSYTTSSTDQHPYGLTLYSTTFSRMSTTTFGPVDVIAGKTGYTEEAKFCLVSLATRPDGREYVLVTVGGSSKYAPVYDCDSVYGTYLF